MMERIVQGMDSCHHHLSSPILHTKKSFDWIRSATQKFMETQSDSLVSSLYPASLTHVTDLAHFYTEAVQEDVSMRSVDSHSTPSSPQLFTSPEDSSSQHPTNSPCVTMLEGRSRQQYYSDFIKDHEHIGGCSLSRHSSEDDITLNDSIGFTREVVGSASSPSSSCSSSSSSSSSSSRRHRRRRQQSLHLPQLSSTMIQETMTPSRLSNSHRRKQRSHHDRPVSSVIPRASSTLVYTGKPNEVDNSVFLPKASSTLIYTEEHSNLDNSVFLPKASSTLIDQEDITQNPLGSICAWSIQDPSSSAEDTMGASYLHSCNKHVPSVSVTKKQKTLCRQINKVHLLDSFPSDVSPRGSDSCPQSLYSDEEDNPRTSSSSSSSSNGSCQSRSSSSSHTLTGNTPKHNRRSIISKFKKFTSSFHRKNSPKVMSIGLF